MATTLIQSLDGDESIATVFGLMFGAGNIWFVDSGNSSAADNASSGTLKTTPFATLGFAAGRVTASNGDIILVLPGHLETITAADGIRFVLAGVQVIGLGDGTDRPTFNFTTATTADIEIDAANITFRNLFFDMTGIDALVTGIDVNASHFTMTHCEVLMADSGGQAETAVDLDANADHAKIIHCGFFGPTAGDCDEAINISGTLTNIEIGHCWFDGDFDVGCISSGSVFTEGYVHDNVLKNDQSNIVSIAFTAACTGVLRRNVHANDRTAATGVNPGSMRSFESYHVDTTDVSGILDPVAT